MALTLAIFRINGVWAPISAASVAAELTQQLRILRPKVIFTVSQLLETTLQAARACQFPEDKIYICEMPGDRSISVTFPTLSRLRNRGRLLAELEPISQAPGKWKRQVAYICSSSGTSGFPVSFAFSFRSIGQQDWNRNK